jgi:hypothetical protein
MTNSNAQAKVTEEYLIPSQGYNPIQRLNYRQTTEKCQPVGGQTLSILHLT